MVENSPPDGAFLCQTAGVEREQALEGVDLAVGKVIEAQDLPGARGPSYRLVVDLGPRGQREATLSLPTVQRDELLGRQVVCSLGPNAALVLGAQSRARGLVLLRPDEDVEEGSPIA